MKKIIIFIMAAALLLLTGCKNEVEIPPEMTSPAQKPVQETVTSAEAPTEAAAEAVTLDDLAKAKYQNILSGSSKDKSVLDKVSALNQLDGMEAGCEALALTAAINHFGYDLGIDDIVDDYLVYCDEGFVTGYCGDPHYFYEGAGIFPPGIVSTAWNFINDKKAEFYPIDTTGLSMSELYKLIDAGCPVLIWTTYDRNEPDIEYTETYKGVEYPWYASEHCVCLFGYDKKEGLVKVADSWGGYEDWESAEWFGRLYDDIGRFSVALMPTDDIV